MAEGRGERSASKETKEHGRRKRVSSIPETNSLFVQAFADALKDILVDEHHRVA